MDQLIVCGFYFRTAAALAGALKTPKKLQQLGDWSVKSNSNFDSNNQILCD